MQKIRTLIADDHSIVRAGIRQFLESAPDIEVVAEAEDRERAKSLIQTEHPDVAVLDIQMPKATGIEVTRWAKANAQGVGILNLTAYNDDPYVMAVIQAGANGYVLKTAAPDDIIQAVQDYLAYYKDADLAIKEIMIFDNNSYAIITEKSTGVGAFELLVDPLVKTAYPEYGPTMMWNLKYGMHSGYGMMGGDGMIGNYQQPQNVDAEIPVSADEATKYAQDYLDKYQPGVTVSEEITPFYGYYTIDLEKGGQIVGMLSVNGYDGQVFYHSWHGAFIEISEE